MTAIFVAWGVSAAALILLAAFLGTRVTLSPGPLGILVDNRGRFSLNKLQLVLWSIVILSLVSGVFFGRLLEGVDDPLNIKIPDEVLGLLGISVGSAVTTGVVKASKNKTASAQLATAANTGSAPFFGQVFMLEEGDYADQIVDVTKFQNRFHGGASCCVRCDGHQRRGQHQDGESDDCAAGLCWHIPRPCRNQLRRVRRRQDPIAVGGSSCSHPGYRGSSRSNAWPRGPSQPKLTRSSPR